MNIYQRVNKVMQAVEYVQKDSTVSTGGGSYKAVSHDMVLAVLRKAMVEQGIVTVVKQLAGDLIQQRAPKGETGHTMHLYAAAYEIRFVNIEKPEDFIETVIHAHANDSGDKAPGKSLSYAVKFAMLKTFGLETGEDDEQRFADPYTPEQFATYHELVSGEKAYEFYMFIATLPHETQIALVNSFPDGKKVQGKKAVAVLEQAGNAAFRAVVEEVQSRLANHDISVIEITDEMSHIEKQLLASRLSKHEVEQLSKIKAASL